MRADASIAPANYVIDSCQDLEKQGNWMNLPSKFLKTSAAAHSEREQYFGVFSIAFARLAPSHFPPSKPISICERSAEANQGCLFAKPWILLLGAG